MPRDSGPGAALCEHSKDESCSVFETQRVRSINFEEPEACPFLKDILSTLRTGTPREKLLAVRDLSGALPVLNVWRDDNMVAAAVHLLDCGAVLPIIQTGLQRAAFAGDWMESQHDPTGVQVLIKPVIYCDALARLAHDSRSTAFVLDRIPNLLEALQALLSKELPHLGGDADLVVSQTHDSVVLALLSILAWSKRGRRELARMDVLLQCLCRRSVEYLSDVDFIHSALTVLFWASPFVSARTLKNIAPWCLKALCKVLDESGRRYPIEAAVLVLTKLALHKYPTFWRLFLTDKMLVQCAKVLAIVSNGADFTRRVGQAVVGSHLKKLAGVEVDQKEYLRIFAAQVSSEEHREIQAAVASSE
jgi:hypothetical protein